MSEVGCERWRCEVGRVRGGESQVGSVRGGECQRWGVKGGDVR